MLGPGELGGLAGARRLAGQALGVPLALGLGGGGRAGLRSWLGLGQSGQLYFQLQGGRL